mmetsp:Transcript_88319/g.189677  ORF Transcript_88319/g.189677 Transcript_88319/m.189677 type:complete len:250 (-) Transcript_88319:1903-2652(-)
MDSSSARFAARCNFRSAARLRCFSTVLTCTSCRKPSAARSRRLYSSALCSIVLCSCCRSASRWLIFCSASEFACVQSRRLFFSDCTCLFRFVAVEADLLFFALGSNFRVMASRLWMARSISMIICSCRRFSWSRRSSMRWISFFMAEESAWPMLGSKASCISLSRVILRSQRRTWRSASRISCVIPAFSSLIVSTERSMSKHWPSISLSFCTNSVSIMTFELESSFDFVSFFITWPFMRSMSKRKCFMA